MYEKKTLGYSSLYPYMGNETLNLHYNVIYDKYLNNLNRLLSKNNYNNNYSLSYLVNNIDMFNIGDRGELLYNLGAVLNHSLYFYNVSDKKNNIPVGKLNDAIIKKYGNYEKFKEEFNRMANNLVGSGYTFLVLDSNKELRIINMSNQDTPYSYGFIPIMCIDLWEHAYFLDYRSDKDKYINSFFEIVDYVNINSLYEEYIK